MKVELLKLSIVKVDCNLSANFIALIKKGKKLPSLFTLYKISKVLNIDISFFFITKDKIPIYFLLKKLEKIPTTKRKYFIKGMKFLIQVILK